MDSTHWKVLVAHVLILLAVRGTTWGEISFDAFPNGIQDAADTHFVISQSGGVTNQEIYQPIPARPFSYIVNSADTAVVLVKNPATKNEIEMDLSDVTSVDVVMYFRDLPSDPPPPNHSPLQTRRVRLYPEMFVDTGVKSRDGHTVWFLNVNFRKFVIPANTEAWIGLIYNIDDPNGAVGIPESHLKTKPSGYGRAWIRNLDTGDRSFFTNQSSPPALHDGILAIRLISVLICTDIVPVANGDDQTNVDDLIFLIGEWGRSSTPADVTNDKMVDRRDLIALLQSWGNCQDVWGTLCYYPASPHRCLFDVLDQHRCQNDLAGAFCNNPGPIRHIPCSQIDNFYDCY